MGAEESMPVDGAMAISQRSLEGMLQDALKWKKSRKRDKFIKKLMQEKSWIRAWGRKRGELKQTTDPTKRTDLKEEIRSLETKLATLDSRWKSRPETRRARLEGSPSAPRGRVGARLFALDSSVRGGFPSLVLDRNGVTAAVGAGLEDGPYFCYVTSALRSLGRGGGPSQEMAEAADLARFDKQFRRYVKAVKSYWGAARDPTARRGEVAAKRDKIAGGRETMWRTHDDDHTSMLRDCLFQVADRCADVHYSTRTRAELWDAAEGAEDNAYVCLMEARQLDNHE